MMVLIHDEVGRIGQILSEPISPDYLEQLRENDVRFVVVKKDIDHFEVFRRFHVADGAAVERQPFPASIDRTEIAADGKDKAIITGLPQPCTLLVDGIPVERKGGTLTLTSDTAADYEIKADHWPFLPWSVTVKAR